MGPHSDLIVGLHLLKDEIMTMWIKLKPYLHFCQAESNFESFSVRVEARNKMEAQIFFLKMRKDVNQICFSNSKIEEFSLNHFYRGG